jgi:uncharacterized iron-regulated membrane protein
MTKLKWFLLCFLIILLIIPAVFIFWLYRAGLKGLPENTQPVQANKYNKLMCEVIWIETGGTGPIRMTPIGLIIFLIFLVQQVPGLRMMLQDCFYINEIILI